MHITRLTEGEIRDIYRKYMRVDFPRNELKFLKDILRSFKAGKYYCIGCYDEVSDRDENGSDGDSGNELTAYACMVCNGQYRLLDYFAVRSDLRGKGVGTDFLKRIVTDEGKSVIFVEAEDPDHCTDEDERIIRKRRIDFYHRAGFEDLPFTSETFGVRYRLFAINLPHQKEAASGQTTSAVSGSDLSDLKKAYMEMYTLIYPLPAVVPLVRLY